MPKVLHLRSTGAFLGAESVVLELCANLPELGYETNIGLLHDSRDPYPELAIRAKERDLCFKVFEARSRIDTNCIKQIKEHVAAFKPDIVHCHGYKEDLYALAARTGLPLVATNHLWKKANWILKAYALVDSLALTQFQAIAAVSTPILEEMSRYFYLSKSKMRVIPNGVDISAFEDTDRTKSRESLGLETSTTAIGTISSLTTVKGHSYLFEALAGSQINTLDWKLFIAGDGPLKNDLKAKCKTLGIEDKVRFLGARSDIPELLAGLDVFALPSLKEGLPMALLEAMAAGKACIASSVGQIPKVLENQGTGIQVPPKDVRNLADALSRLLSDRKLVQSMGDSAKQLVQTSYSAKAMAGKYAELYNEVLKT
jgi:glycosyltransferase involved in cell wall biosynthesis